MRRICNTGHGQSRKKVGDVDFKYFRLIRRWESLDVKDFCPIVVDGVYKILVKFLPTILNNVPGKILSSRKQRF